MYKDEADSLITKRCVSLLLGIYKKKKKRERKKEKTAPPSLHTHALGAFLLYKKRLLIYQLSCVIIESSFIISLIDAMSLPIL